MNTLKKRAAHARHFNTQNHLRNVLDYSAKTSPFPKAKPGKKLYIHPAIFALCFMLILSCAYLLGGAA